MKELIEKWTGVL